jgi:hypothetical protein
MPIEAVKSKSQVNLARFRVVINILFWLCTALTVASIVFDIGFKTAMTGAATVILHFVRQSANEMTESES